MPADCPQAAKTVTRLVRTSPSLSVVPVSCDVSSGGVVAHGYDDPVEQRTDVTSDRAWAVPIWILEDCLMAKRQAQVKSEPALPVLQPDAAGLDIGSAEIWVCVPADRDAAAGAPFCDVHARSASVGGLAGGLPDYQRRHGGHGRVLVARLRDSGSPWAAGLLGQPAPVEARARAQE